MKQLFLIYSFSAISFGSIAQNTSLADTVYYTSASGKDSIVTIQYFTGQHQLSKDVATLSVPKGFKYFKPAQSKIILESLWGNPPADLDEGLLMPIDLNPVNPQAWAVEYSYDPSGYVEDDDAKDIDYDDLLEEMQEDTKKASEERIKQGYQAISLVGWAVKPFYDEDNKKLHWAKEIKFGTDSANTLNYNIRILGRKGVLVLNVIAGMNQLPDVNKHLPELLSSTEFNKGYKYGEFNPDLDQVAVYTVGGLIAGKVLAKVGLWAVLAKFAKVIIAGIIGLGTVLWKFLTGRKNKEQN